MKINKEIDTDEVKVLNSDNEFIGILSIKTALNLAQNEAKDLLCINDSSSPWLCKIQKHDKYLYEEKKRLKEKKKHSTKVVIKEVQLRPNTDTNDLKIKANRVEKFLNDGNIVKVNLKIKGRERNYMDIAQETFDNFLSLITNYKIEKNKNVTDNSISVQIKKGE